MKKTAGRGVNLKHGIQQKRLFFAVPDESIEIANFLRLCEQINTWAEIVDLHTLIHMVIEFLQHHGYEWIAK